MSGFAEHFFARLLEAGHQYDPDSALAGPSARGRGPRPLADRVRLRAATVAGRRGWTRARHDPREAPERLANIARGIAGLDRTYALLADDASRALLVELFLFRVLGAEHVRSPVAFADYEAAKAALTVQARDVAVVDDPHTPRLSRFRVPGPGGTSIDVCSAAPEIASVFSLRQYGHPSVARRPGDVVLDGGAGWGDTALYFADAVGAGGRVLSLEISPANIAVIEANLAANPSLADRVSILPYALWDTSDEQLEFSEAGQVSMLGTDAPPAGAGGGARARTRTIDDLVEQEGLTRLDLVKLDIEGAEPHALRGARRTLRELRPDLAVCLYHDPMHFIELPAFLDDLDVGYRMHLGHAAAGTPETVLFATVRD